MGLRADEQREFPSGNAPEPRLKRSAREACRRLRRAYRTLRAVENHLLNRLDPPIVILVYHRVTDLPSDPEMLAVSPANFRGHLAHLKARYPILRFEEDWSAVKEPALVITFDDGYADNCLQALPILEELAVPATFFISTGHIGTEREFWWHQLERILLHGGESPPRFRLDDRRHGREWPTASPAQRRALYAALNFRMQRVEAQRREHWLEHLRQWAGCGVGGGGLHRSMTVEELRRLAASPCATIGAHTVTHSALTGRPEAEQRQEICTSKRDLERLIEREVTTFSYPFGRKADYDRTSVRLCREAGFTKAAANFPGQWHRWTDPLQIPRHLVRNWDVETFAGEMKGFWTR